MRYGELESELLLSRDGLSSVYLLRGLSLAFYLGVVVVIQLLLNVTYLVTKCGGALDKNIGAAALFTFIPWVLIFGVMLAVLIIFPGFKSAFSDVLGYYAVAGSANDIFSVILISIEIILVLLYDILLY